jgi:hypothetical protein
LAEEFQEEEVVLDRYASDVEIFADVPRVTSWEGRKLASMLWPVDPPAPLTVTPQSEIPKPARVRSADTATARSAGIGDDQVVEFAATGPTPTDGISIGDEMEATENELVSDADQATFWAGAKVSSDERAMIIVEDNPATQIPPRPRKREYRQLFAKLRRK